MLKDLLQLYGQLFYHRFVVRMIAVNDVVFDAWTGAVIRNNLLYAAEHVLMAETKQTLRNRIDTFPLEDTHPLYKELREGFPKGYVLTDFSHSNLQTPETSIKKNEIVSFSLILIGNYNNYKSYFFQAIRKMCERGFGKPLTPFRLLDIAEQSPAGESQVMAAAQDDLSETLLYPVRLFDFIRKDEIDEFSEITVRYLTPAILFRLKNKKNTQLSYQDKNNRFPSFYQLVRSTFFRLQKLHAIYGNPDEYAPELFDAALLENYLEKAGSPLLKSANIRYITLQNTQKKEKTNEMPLSGYTGEAVYSGYFRKYLPLLRFMEALGVGNEVVYGMGRYETEEDNGKNISSGANNRDKQNFKRVSILTVRFKNEIDSNEIQQFRDTVMKMLTGNNVFSYTPTGKKLRHPYPLIQYKRLNGKASIVCVEEGTESIGEFFSNIRNSFYLDDKEILLELDSVKASQTLVQIWNSNFTYSIRKWQPFNSMNYATFQQTDDLQAKIAFLEKILNTHILAFVKEVGIRFEREFRCSIIDIEAKESMKDSVFASFDLMFKTNVSLPNYIGLGKGASHGFGTIIRMNNNNNIYI
ncbi:MAG: CRISPR system precrRNA processing endoribonuclease RAMP protein Cas6 [Prevotellaceae bacterium]|jgi:hypothetical protein|nr:CRISPR system precrRNA processing endoribonuclease RAMP protein Cas6 [Prevotellaceae bacterium]